MMSRMRATLSREPNKDRLANQIMADIELDDLWDRGQSSRRVIVETVAGMNLKAMRVRELRAGASVASALPRPPIIPGQHGLAVGSGMDLHRVGADRLRRRDLPRVGVDEHGDLDAGVAQPRNEGADAG